jgi:hypothetical protein
MVEKDEVRCDVCGDVIEEVMAYEYEEVADMCCTECLNNLLLAEEVLAKAFRTKA